MFKNIIISIYIIAVLLLSGFAKAAALNVNEVSYDAKHMLLTISGQQLDGCNTKIIPQITQTQNLGTKVVAEVKLNPVTTNDFCTQGFNVEKNFDMVMDVRTLGLTPGFDYVLNVANNNSQYSFEFFLPADSSVDSFDNVDHSGMLVVMADGSAALIKGAREVVKLTSTIDLAKYNGQNVSISGIEFVHQVGPIVEVNALDPLRELDNKSSVFVLNIFTVTK